MFETRARPVPDVRAVDTDRLIDERYRLGPVIGCGAMGDVYDAKDLRLRRPVAVKLLRAELATDVDLRGRFEREARAAARLAHPNVVAVFDTGEDHRTPFIVMERLSGRTLADEIRDGPLSEARTRTVASQVLGALAAAHAANVLHRDIKPANVLLAENGDVKVADFGIAKILDDARTDLTSAGLVLGSSSYVAPERVRGGAASASSDVYSVGVLLYEALSAGKPFSGDTPVSVMHAVINQEPRPLHELRPDVSPSLVAVVSQAMAKDPLARFQSADEMAAALGGRAVDEGTVPLPLVSSDPVIATSVLEPLAEPGLPRNRRAPIAALVVACVVVLLLLAAFGPRDADPGAATPTSTPATAPPATLAPTTVTIASPVSATPATPRKKHGKRDG